MKIIDQHHIDNYLSGNHPFEFKSHWPEEYYGRLQELQALYRECTPAYQKKIEEIIVDLFVGEEYIGIESSLHLNADLKVNQMADLLSQVISTGKYKNYPDYLQRAMMQCAVNVKISPIPASLFSYVIEHDLVIDYLVFWGKIEFDFSYTFNPPLRGCVNDDDIWRMNQLEYYYLEANSITQGKINTQMETLFIDAERYAEKLKNIIWNVLSSGESNLFRQKLDGLIHSVHCNDNES